MSNDAAAAPAAIPAETWEFAGWGTAERILDVPAANPPDPSIAATHHASTLGTRSSTAICGNDITSSCL